MSRSSADRAAAWATGIGIGLIAFMVGWVIGNRVTSMVWDPPVAPIAALGTAIVIGVVTSVICGRSLAARVTGGPDATSRR